MKSRVRSTVTPAQTVEMHPETPNAAQTRVVISPGGEPATGDSRPPLFVPRDEVLYWTREWRAGEAESASERERGNLRVFDNGTDLLDWLRKPED